MGEAVLVVDVVELLVGLLVLLLALVLSLAIQLLRLCRVF